MFKKPSIQDIIMSPKEIKLKRVDVAGEAGVKGRPQDPLEAGRCGTLSEKLRKVVRDKLAGMVAGSAILLSSSKLIPETPGTVMVDSKKRREEGEGESNEPICGPECVDMSNSTVRPMEDAYRTIMPVEGDRIKIGEVEMSAVLGGGDHVSASDGFSVMLLDVREKDGEYVAKLVAYAPWLEKEIVIEDAKPGAYCSVPLPDGTETYVRVSNVFGSSMKRPLFMESLDGVEIDIIRDVKTVGANGISPAIEGNLAEAVRQDATVLRDDAQLAIRGSEYKITVIDIGDGTATLKIEKEE